MKPLTQQMSWHKKCRRRHIELNLEEAEKSPALLAAAMERRGLWAPGTGEEERIEYVEKMAKIVRTEGKKLAHLTPEEFRMLKTPEKVRNNRGHKFSGLVLLKKEDLPSRQNVGNPWKDKRVLDRMINEALYSTGTDEDFNRINNKLGLKREGHSLSRQLRIIWENENGYLLYDYQPTDARECREGMEWSHLEDRIAQFHYKNRYKISATARFLQRTPQEINVRLGELLKKKENTPQSRQPSSGLLETQPT